MKISYIYAGEKLIWETKVYFRITDSSMRKVYVLLGKVGLRRNINVKQQISFRKKLV